MMTEDFFSKIKDDTIHFFCSDYFILSLSVLTVLFWAAGLEIVGCAVFVGLASLYLWIGSDLRPAIAIIMFITMIFSLNEINSPRFIVLLEILTPLLIISISYNLTRFSKSRSYKKGKLFYGMLTAYIATLLSGITYNGYNKVWTLTVVGIGLGIYLLYFLCINCVKGDFAEYICKILFFAGLIVSAQTIIWFARQPDFTAALLSKELRVGWGMSNTMGVVFAMAVPASVWLGTNNKFYSYLMFPVSALFTCMLMLTLSRGNILFGLPIILIALVYGFVKATAKREARILAVATAVAIVVIVAFLPITGTVLERLSSFGFSPNGRIEVYGQAIRNFIVSPIFGVGYFKASGVAFNDGPSLTFLWKSHNTFLQILSCSGIIGFVGLAPYYIQRYWLLLSKITAFKFIALLSILAYEFEGLVDVAFLSIHQLFFVFGLLAAAEIETYYKQSSLQSDIRKTTKII